MLSQDKVNELKKLVGGLASIVLFLLSGISFGQAPNLGSAANFILFTSTGSVSNTGNSQLTGNIGSNSTSSTGFSNVNGTMQDNNAVSALCATDLMVAYNQLDTTTATASHTSSLGNGDTLNAGVYHISTAATLDSALILNAQGNPNAVFIFQVQGTFGVHTSARIILINGAKAANVFWKVEGAVSLAAGTTMKGTIVAHAGAINISAGANLEGRALSTGGAVTINNIVAYVPFVSGSLTGPAAPNLATVNCYAIFSASGAITNTGTTTVTGDVGSNSGGAAGFTVSLVTGTVHATADGSTGTAASDLGGVYTYLSSLSPDITLLFPSLFGHNLSLTPHTYLLNAATVLTDTLYLDAQGNSNAVFVIKVNGALSTSNNSRVILMNGAQIKNIFWVVEGAVDINNGSIFNGTVVANNDAITLNSGVLLNGRALATNGAITSTAMTVIANVLPNAGSITGISGLCAGATITLTNTVTGGAWSSSNPKATVSAGVVTGVSPGLDTIRYIVSNACGSDTATKIITVNPLPFASCIVGERRLFIGSTVTLTDTATGGTWRATNGIATVSGGVVTGVTPGTDTIMYIVTNVCGSDTAIKTVIVNGVSNVCVGATLTLTDVITGGTWSSSNATATVAGGIITGVAAGIDTIRYVVASSCGMDTASTVITINPLPNAGAITGTTTACAGATTTLGATIAGGTWSSVSTGIATISAGGIVTGITAGMDTIRYVVTNSCGVDTATTTVTINPLPIAGTITGTTTVCAGSTTTLNDVATGGTWSSVSTGIATISAGGIVTGVSAGTSTISYTVTNSCGIDVATTTVTVSPLPIAGTITGTTTVCAGSTTTLNDVATGGTWSSVTTGIATISAGGIVTGVSAGTSTISYTVTNSCGTDVATTTVTVSPLPIAGSITGTTTVCAGSATTLNDMATGGTWSSVTTGVATISTGGIVTGVSAGTSTISYTVTNSCGTDVATTTVTVSPLPIAGSITGTTTVCAGSTTTLNDVATGGTWSSVTTGVATISTGGIVTGVSAGTSTISYTVTNSCGTDVATTTVTVSPLPVAGTITGTTTVCAGSTTTLSNVATGGTWSSVSTGVATISTGGIVTGVSAGTSVISYTVINSCGTVVATTTATVSPLPVAGTITGTMTLCAGATTTLSDVATGGTWSSVSTGVATISTIGIVTGVSAGTSTISYTVTNSCGTDVATTTVTVSPLPIAGTITGTTTVCAGSTTTLNDMATGGTWSSVTTGVATISTGGIVTGVSAGTSTISYTVTNSCGTDVATTTVTVSPLPIAGTITGTTTVCAGSTSALNDVATGGTWSSVTTGIATISTGGIVTGVSAGTSVISYTVTNSCGTDVAATTVTVSPLPIAGSITGTTIVCAGSTTTLNDMATGGTWSSVTTGVATISTGGLVTGVSAGTSTISYTVTNSCGTDVATTTVTVSPLPIAGSITGTTTVCAGSTSTLSDVATGGTWSSVTTGVATISTGGIVTGVSAGTSTISYTVTNSCGTDVATTTVTVSPLPIAGSITGTTTVCAGSTTTLNDAATGGTWSSVTTGVATISTGGIVTGVSAGTSTISYTVTNSCGTNVATTTLTVSPLPNAGTITGADSSVCIPDGIVLTDAVTGGFWSSSSFKATVTGGVVTGLRAGTVTISYTVTNTCGTATATKIVTVNPLPDAGNIVAH